jgi:hypothetical protein
MFGRKNLRQGVGITTVLGKVQSNLKHLFYFPLRMMTESETEPLCDGIN